MKIKLPPGTVKHEEFSDIAEYREGHPGDWVLIPSGEIIQLLPLLGQHKLCLYYLCLSEKCGPPRQGTNLHDYYVRVFNEWKAHQTTE